MKQENGNFWMVLNEKNQLCGFIAADYNEPEIEITNTKGVKMNTKALYY